MVESFDKIKSRLPELLGQHLLTNVYEIRRQKLTRIAKVAGKILEKLSESEHINNAEQIIESGLRQIEALQQSTENKPLPEQILDDITALKKIMPENIGVEQAPERFEVAADDGLHIKMAKGIKRLLRGMGKTKWTRKIRLQHVVTYHLLDAGQWYKNWIAAEDRLLMDFILELEQALRQPILQKTPAGGEAKLRQLLQVFLNQIEEAQSVLDQKLDEARIALNNELQNAVSKAGTIEQRAGFYSAKRISRKKEKTKKQLEKFAEDWQQANDMLLKRALSLYRFVVLCDDVSETVDGYKEKTKEVYTGHFVNTQEKLIQKIGLVRQQIANSEQKLSTILAQQEQALSAYVGDELIEPLQKIITDGELEHMPDTFAGQLMNQANKLPENVLLITNVERNDSPPEVKSREVRWRLLIIRAMKEHLLKPITGREDSIRQFIHEQLREAQEVKDIIEVNLESASALNDDQTARDNPREVVDQALQRAQSKINASVDEARQAIERSTAPLDEGLQQFKSTIFELLHHADAKKMQVLDAKYKMSEKTLDWRTKMGARWARLQDRAAVVTRFGWKKTKELYNRLATWMGLKKRETEEGKQANIAAYLSETEQQFEELPYIYRRLFDFKAIPEQRYYVGLNENFGYVQEAFDHWQNGLSATMAVVGEKGSGKSTYLNLLNSNILADHKVLHISLDETLWTAADLLSTFRKQFPKAELPTMDALVQFIKEKQEHRIIIFEGVQNLYVRQINGYEAIEQFIYLVAETADDIFWLIGCSRYAWSFLGKAVNLNEYFSHIIETDTLSESQLQKAIMSRHRASGYELVFASSESDIKSRGYKKLMDNEEKAQEYLKSKYFRDLAKLSDGNTSIGMIFWLRSIQKFDETHCYMAPLEVAALEMVEDLSPQTLFVLASLVLHDTLKAEELSAIQSINAQESRMVLKRLKSRGIVADSDHGYYLNHLIYRQVVDELKERNILHL